MSEISTIYGPVLSWRVGLSLGVDLILETSVCSFNCIYCQLGKIQRITNERKLFVPTDRILRDFCASRWREADIITYSGSGEPTLAMNLGECAREIGKIASIPQLTLTNGTLLDHPAVMEDLRVMDKVFVKLDAGEEEMFQRINRPVKGISLAKIIENIRIFRQKYDGYFGIQIMFLPANLSQRERLAQILLEIQPDEAQLNTPKRPYPKHWHVSSRGGHNEELREYDSVPLRTISVEEAHSVEDYLRRETGLKIVSVYKHCG
ncbi:MAG: radical SAM protein [Candidatus Omnitrophota bacterium]